MARVAHAPARDSKPGGFLRAGSDCEQAQVQIRGAQPALLATPRGRVNAPKRRSSRASNPLGAPAFHPSLRKGNTLSPLNAADFPMRGVKTIRSGAQDGFSRPSRVAPDCSRGSQID